MTSDTQGIAGTPDIVATILKKIDESAVFVCDVTPIAISKGGKACANPNVLLELGYANKSLGVNRIVQVWNNAFEGAEVERLPFDMRGRRGPLSFELPIGSTKEQLRLERGKLTRALADALRLAFTQLPSSPSEAVHWHPHIPGDPDVWFDSAEPQTINNPKYGSRRVRLIKKFPGYARIIPSKWSANSTAKNSLAAGETISAILRRSSSIIFGRSQGGTMACAVGGVEDGIDQSYALTQWFETTGEFWGIGGSFLFERVCVSLASASIYWLWLDFLAHNCKLALSLGGSLPIHVRLGVHDLRNSWWPRPDYGFLDEGFAAVEQSYEYLATIDSINAEVLQENVVKAFNGLADAYGIPGFTHDQIVALSRR